MVDWYWKIPHIAILKNQAYYTLSHYFLLNAGSYMQALNFSSFSFTST